MTLVSHVCVFKLILKVNVLDIIYILLVQHLKMIHKLDFIFVYPFELDKD